MLQINKRLVAEQPFAASEFVSPAEVYAAVVGFVRRQFSVIASVLLLLLAVAVASIFTSAPPFTGHAVLLIDPHQSHLFGPVESPLADLSVGGVDVDTQLEILK